MNALDVKDLTKTFEVGKTLFSKGQGVQAVRRMSFEVRDGETLGIVGESGCGKSTLARMLVGLLPPSEGAIEIEGKVQDKANPREFGQMIQYVFQDPISSLNPRKTIRQIMETPLKRLHGMAKAERRKRISEIFDSVNLREEFLDRYPHEFSGGQAQRIGIARGLGCGRADFDFGRAGVGTRCVGAGASAQSAGRFEKGIWPHLPVYQPRFGSGGSGERPRDGFVFRGRLLKSVPQMRFLSMPSTRTPNCWRIVRLLSGARLRRRSKRPTNCLIRSTRQRAARLPSAVYMLLTFAKPQIRR